LTIDAFWIYIRKEGGVCVVFDKIVKLLAEQLGIDESTISMDTNITEDLGADSLDVVELLMASEEEFGITISDEDAIGFKTVGDVVSHIEKAM